MLVQDVKEANVMKQKIYIDKQLSEKILMIGVAYKNDAPGGMASLIATYEKHYYKLRYIASWKLSNKFVKAFYALKSLIEFVILLSFDHRIKIVHIHGAAYASFRRKKIFIKIASFYKKRILYHMHAGEFEAYYNESSDKKGIVNTLMSVDKLIVLSNTWSQFFEKIGVLPQKIIVLNNIIPYPTERYFWKSNYIEILYLGTLVEAKGIFDLLNVIKDNQNTYRNYVRFTIGGNRNENIIRKFINENKLNDFVNFEGWITGEKKIRILNKSDIYILPSYYEGLPMAILEAMSYACPIIATKVGGIPEIIKDRENGIIITPGNEDEINKAILFFMKDPIKIREYGVKSLEIVKDFYPDVVLNTLKSIYQSQLI